MVGAFQEPSCGRTKQPIHSISYSVAQPLERGFKNYYSIIQGGRGRRSGSAETKGVSARQVKTGKKFARRRKDFAKPRCSEPRTGFTDARGAARFRAKSRGFGKSIPLTYGEGIDHHVSSGFRENRILRQTAKLVFGNKNQLRCFHHEKTGGFYEHQK